MPTGRRRLASSLRTAEPSSPNEAKALSNNPADNTCERPRDEGSRWPEEDQAHELSHVVLRHTLRAIEKERDVLVTCDIEQEHEADWLGDCLLLPRTVLLQAAKQGKTAERIAKECETNEQMARFRHNDSGVLVQVGRAKAARHRQARRSG